MKIQINISKCFFLLVGALIWSGLIACTHKETREPKGEIFLNDSINLEELLKPLQADSTREAIFSVGLIYRTIRDTITKLVYHPIGDAYKIENVKMLGYDSGSFYIRIFSDKPTGYTRDAMFVKSGVSNAEMKRAADVFDALFEDGKYKCLRMFESSRKYPYVSGLGKTKKYQIYLMSHDDSLLFTFEPLGRTTQIFEDMRRKRKDKIDSDE